VTTKVPFEVVVEQQGPTVLRVCRALHGHAEAADVWSETFLSALRSYDQLPPDANVTAWLLTIARRRAVDEHRRRARRPEPRGELPDGAAPDPVRLDVQDPLLAAVAALPPTQRAAVSYRYLGDLAYDRIAELLGSSPAAARRAAADGIAALRAQHQHWEDR
jgi:RNA polymerase sigma factor (sigma-70 family)